MRTLNTWHMYAASVCNSLLLIILGSSRPFGRRCSRSAQVMHVLSAAMNSKNNRTNSSCCLRLTAPLRARADRPFLFPEHRKQWATEWQQGSVSVSGNSRLSRAINSSLYYLMSSSSPELPLSLSPGGLASNGTARSSLQPPQPRNYYVTCCLQATTATHSGTASRGCFRHCWPFSPGPPFSCCSSSSSVFDSSLCPDCDMSCMYRFDRLDGAM
jgi:hypothetical protein